MHWGEWLFICGCMGFALLVYGAMSFAEDYRVERDFWQKDSYVVRDESGGIKARVEKSFWREDSYTIRDDAEDTGSEFQTNDSFWRNER